MNNIRSIFLKYKDTFVQFIKFGIVGLSNTLIYLLIYYVLVALKVPFIIANGIGFLVSIINAFYWNIKFVFRQNATKIISSFIKVSSAYGGTFLMSTILLYFFVNVLMISKLIAPILNLLITIPLNFTLIKFWALKDINPKEEGSL